MEGKQAFLPLNQRIPDSPFFIVTTALIAEKPVTAWFHLPNSPRKHQASADSNPPENPLQTPNPPRNPPKPGHYPDIPSRSSCHSQKPTPITGSPVYAEPSETATDAVGELNLRVIASRSPIANQVLPSDQQQRLIWIGLHLRLVTLLKRCGRCDS